MDHGHIGLMTDMIGIGAFLLFIAVMHHYTRRTPLPYESWLVLAGVAYAHVQKYLMPELPGMVLAPEVVMLLILPILIFGSGRGIEARRLVKEGIPITYLAVFGTLFGTVAMGLPLAWVLDLPWSHGLMFGAAVAATDPSAVGVIFKRFVIPKRLELLIEGESLFNDGVAIVLFTVLSAVVLANAELNPGQTTLQLLWSVGAAIPIGLLTGWLVGKLIHRWREQNQFVGLTLTVILAYGTFILAETLLYASGVIAVLCTALIFVQTRCGSRQASGNSDTDMFQSFWGYLNTLAGSLLFFTLGVAVGEHVFFWTWAIPVVIVIMLLARAALVYGGALLQPRHTRLPLAWRHILMLGGLRGAASAALVQLIPADYPYRITFLCLVFVLVMFTLIVQPPLLKAYLARQPLPE